MGSTIGLFFGSFNPIHNGHLAIARYLLDKNYCEKVWFVISPCNPWKAEQFLLDEQKRLEMVQLAIAGDRRMQACDIEFSMPRPSYTFQTLQALSKKYFHQHFALIMGGDNFRDFCKWKNYEYILTHFQLLVYPRPGIELPESTSSDIIVVNAPMTSLSSTEIREKLKQGMDISAFVPVSVLPLLQEYYKEAF